MSTMISVALLGNLVATVVACVLVAVVDLK